MLIAVWIMLGKESAKAIGPFLMGFVLLNLMNSLNILDEKSFLM